MLKCLIAFILGWLASHMMGSGFSVGGQPRIVTDKCIGECKRKCNKRGDYNFDCHNNCTVWCIHDPNFYELFNEEGKCNNGEYYDPSPDSNCKNCINSNLDPKNSCWCKSKNKDHVIYKLDPSTNCTTCKNPLLDPNTDCTTCKNRNRDKDNNCSSFS